MGDSIIAEDRKIEASLRAHQLFPNTSAPWQQGVLRGVLKKLTICKTDICLDAASGVGNNLPTLLGFFEHIYAFDKSSKAINFAQERFTAFTNKRVHWQTGVMEKMGYKDETFGLVVCTEALEHVKDVRAAVQEMFRVTKPGGYVLLSFQNHFNLSAVTKFIYEKVRKKNWDAWGTHGHEEGYENYLTCFEIRNLVQSLGFSIDEEFGADYLNAWFSWIPWLHKNYKILNEHPFLPLGKIPLIKYVGMDYFMLLKK